MKYSGNEFFQEREKKDIYNMTIHSLKYVFIIYNIFVYLHMI